MKEDIINAIKALIEEDRHAKTYTEEEKIRAAYALNMCMVSVSQIIDYDDLNILEQEYEAILNNLNLEMMPKDEALLTIIKRVLDTITFFRMQEGDKILIDKEYQHEMKNAICKAVPNFGLILSGGNPISMAVSLASQVGIGYMNYRRAKAEMELDYNKKQWHLQKSAMEQFHGLRRELFDTAWRLADEYNFPDQYRLTERQIIQYDDILMDSDELRKYDRLDAIKDRFTAYPPFWYHFGSTANHIARNEELALSTDARAYYRSEAIVAFNKYWETNKYSLLREDRIASACALEYIDLLDVDRDKSDIIELLRKAVDFSGGANDVLQLCAIAYLKIGKRDEAEHLLRILVNEQYNTIVNAQILSGLYVNRVLDDKDPLAESHYNILTRRVNPSYLFRLPRTDETISQESLSDEFAEKQEELLQHKFYAVIERIATEFSVRLGKLIPPIIADREYPDSYFSETRIETRLKEFQELFSSSYKKLQKDQYLERLAQSNFIVEYFKELNQFFDSILDLTCIRDRQKLQELIANKIIDSSDILNSLLTKISSHEVDFNDMCSLMRFTSVLTYEEFISELKHQIAVTVFGMNDMLRYATTDAGLYDFCMNHGLPEPDALLEEGSNMKSDIILTTTYFGFELLGMQGKKIQKEQEQYRKVEIIIKNNMEKINSVSEKTDAYFYDSTEFNEYFDSGKLKNRKDIRQKTIAILDDRSIQNVDILFTVDGMIPVIRKKIGTPIPYSSLASNTVKEKINETFSLHGTNPLWNGVRLATGGLPEWATTAVDMRTFDRVVNKLQPMIDDICWELYKEE